MKIAPRKTTEEAVDGKFLVLWETEDHFNNVTVHRITGRDAAGLPLLDGASGLETGDPEQADIYLTGFIEATGKASLDQAAPQWDGVEGFKAHADLLRHIYERSFALMGGEAPEPWEDEIPPPAAAVSGEAPQYLKPAVLEADFNDALIGLSVAHNVQPRMVYSLTKVAEIEKRRSFMVDDEGTRRRVWGMIMDITRRFGDRAPLFVDDAAFVKEEPKIWSPERN